MGFHRRHFLSAMLSGTALAAAGCAPEAEPPPGKVRFDPARLARGFAGLAQRARPAAFDFGVSPLDGAAIWCGDGTMRSPMQDLVMAPVAAAALAAVDAKRLTFNEPIRLRREDLSPPPSRLNPLVARAAAGFLDVPAAELIGLALQDGDNTAGDALLRRIGGPEAVTAWLRAHDIADMRVDRAESEIQAAIAGLDAFRPDLADEAAWRAATAAPPAATREAAIAAYLADPRDTTTARAALSFLEKLCQGALLSPASTTLMLRMMTTSAGGAGRLLVGLPPRAGLAHKAGTAATVLGLTPAVNDIGVVTLADGRRFAIAVFMSGSTATEAQRDGLIADAARLAVAALN
jgi:beta-lactamase class A